MWSTTYHLRRTKFIVYQLAMIFCVVSESLGTAALTDYNDLQKSIHSLNNEAVLYNDDFVGIGSYNIFVGVYVATIFGAAFFFDLIWPERHENKAVKLAWRVCSLLAVVFVLGDLIALTIIVSSRMAYIYGRGIDVATAKALLGTRTHIPMVYKHNGRCVASVVFLWLAFPAVIGSAVVMWLSLEHDKKFGPLSTHARVAREKSVAVGVGSGRNEDDTSMDMPTYPADETQPKQPHYHEQPHDGQDRSSQEHRHNPHPRATASSEPLNGAPQLVYEAASQPVFSLHYNASEATSIGDYAAYTEPANTLTVQEPYRGTWV